MGKINWFPGHMAKAFGAINRIIKGVDLVLEVRDARIPISSSNPKLNSLLQGKRHMVVLNKVDLINKSDRQAALHHLYQQGLLALPASSSDARSVKQVLKAAVGWMQRERASSELSVMVVLGLPNSGKSSLINAFKLAAKAAGVLDGEEAFRRRAAVGPTPGLTRQVSGFCVSNKPLTYVLDTPGVMMPNIPSDDVGFKLALAGAMKDSIVGEEAMLQYLIHALTTQQQHLAALKASQQPGYRSSSSSSSSVRSGYDAAARKRQQSRVRQMRTALQAAVESGLQPGPPHVVLGGPPFGVVQGVHAAAEPMDWHPSQDDTSYDIRDMQLDVLFQQLGVSGGSNPSLQLGACVRLLEAFRAGELGQYMLDELQ